MFFYMATPFTKYPDGTESAYVMACEEQARLIRDGIPVFCPISHTYGPAVWGGIDLKDHDLWMKVDQPFMDAAHGLIVIRAEGWQESKGVAMEIEEFRSKDKPVIYLDPGEAIPKWLKASMMDDILAV